MNRFKNILCVLAADERAGPELDRALALAEHNQADLSLVSVVEKVPEDLPMPGRGLRSADLQEALVAEQPRRMAGLIESRAGHPVSASAVLIGTPFLETIREVLRNDRDLVIKMAESGGMLGRIFGSDDMHLLRKCPCPVWLMKPPVGAPYRRILAAVDVEDRFPAKELASRGLLTQQILEMSASLALSEFAELHIVHAWDTVGENVIRRELLVGSEEKVAAYAEAERRRHARALSAALDGLAATIGREAMEYLAPEAHLPKGSVRAAVPALAQDLDADLVVMGTVARTGIPGFFIGNTAETILNRLTCSVIAVKPPAFVTPVTVEA
jgi:nucleotide-binding universal stress UspA family protein